MSETGCEGENRVVRLDKTQCALHARKSTHTGHHGDVLAVYEAGAAVPANRDYPGRAARRSRELQAGAKRGCGAQR